ncbi:MAG: hypothetical protein JSV85_03805 [Candidatus Bathyarchaeota archaeon]|nr:MAG: hypothetical protein JSV85_03805 [Candidatus Bathyarchaeota archaeon]
MLEKSKQRVQETEWNRGYFQALQGIFLAKKSNNDRYAFLSNNDFDNADELKNYRHEFLKRTRSKLHADYDRGFFSAWASYMLVLIKREDYTKVKPIKSAKPEQQVKITPEKKVETKPKQIESETSAKPKRIVQTKLT